MRDKIWGVALDQVSCAKITRIYGASFGDIRTAYGCRARYTVTVDGIPKYIAHCGPENQFVAEWEDEGLALEAGKLIVIWGELISGANKLTAKLHWDDRENFTGEDQFPVL